MKFTIHTLLRCTMYLVLCTLFLSSCDNDDFATGAEPPVLDQLTLSPSTVAPGEEVTATVTYKYMGKDVIKMDYSVRAINATIDYNKELATGSLIGEHLANPTFTFKAPDSPAGYRIVFNVTRVSVSTGNAQGGPYVANPSSVFAILTVK